MWVCVRERQRKMVVSCRQRPKDQTTATQALTMEKLVPFLHAPLHASPPHVSLHNIKQLFSPHLGGIFYFVFSFKWETGESGDINMCQNKTINCYPN